MTDYLHDLLLVAQDDVPWQKFSGSNILVTGATGLIGSCLIDILMLHPNRDYQVYATGRNRQRAESRFRTYAQDPAFHLLYHDLTKPLEKDISFDYMIHAAGQASPHFFFDRPVEVMKTHLYGLSNLLDYGIKHGLKRFLFVSSGEIYGETTSLRKGECDYGFIDLLNPRSCYPSSKRAAETLAACYRAEYGTDIVIARPCHTYGPGFTEDDNRAFTHFFRNVLNGENIELKSDGLQYRSWCYVIDCASAILRILLTGDSGKAYNVADNQANITIKDLAEIIASLGGVCVKEPSFSEKGQAPRPFIKRAIFDTTELESLGWTPLPGSIRDKLAHTLSALREEGL